MALHHTLACGECMHIGRGSGPPPSLACGECMHIGRGSGPPQRTRQAAPPS